MALEDMVFMVNYMCLDMFVADDVNWMVERSDQYELYPSAEVMLLDWALWLQL